jgi:hypothetical protein
MEKYRCESRFNNYHLQFTNNQLRFALCAMFTPPVEAKRKFRYSGSKRSVDPAIGAKFIPSSGAGHVTFSDRPRALLNLR